MNVFAVVHATNVRAGVFEKVVRDAGHRLEEWSDPLFSRVPSSFDAFAWHYYTYDVPAGAEELARSSRCNQAFRLGENAWGIQFHAEVTAETVRGWMAEKDEFPPDLDRDTLAAETEERIGGWNDLGRGLCGAFVEAAERAAVAA